MVRVEVGRHDPKYPKLYRKHKIEDTKCVPTLVALANNLGCRQIVISEVPDYDTNHVLEDAFLVKAYIYRTLQKYNFEKAFIVDNDVECLDTNFDVFSLPSFSAFGQSSYNKCFNNKPVGVNGGFLVASKEHVDKFAEIDVDYSYFKECKDKYEKIHAIDEFHIASCLAQTNIKLHAVPCSVQKFPIHGEMKSKFIHWVSNNLLLRGQID